MPRCPAAFQDDVSYATSGTGSLIAPYGALEHLSEIFGFPISFISVYGSDAYNCKPQRINWKVLPKYYI